ncbi:MAG TPA: glycosyltransferase [Solirubrobacteraceae bacterium]|jgi:glycosyltransferase involved in cell wall biosynthesis|nr:glycosyltransferase [Solirubrobacteraceae bacterium]
MRALVLAEYYPRAADATLGVWAHRQAMAARDAGADVRVLVLHRPLPPLSTVRRLRLAALREAMNQPRREVLDGITVEYLRYLSPPRPWSYASWGAWAAPALRLALARVRRAFAFDLVHAHYAVPAGDALRRAAPDVPLLVSVHGGDVHGRHSQSPAVLASLAHARLVLANSAGTARRCRERGAQRTRVVHLGTEVPAEPATAPATPALVTVGNLIARKRQGDVIEALALLRNRHPDLRYVIVGDGPERGSLLALAEARGVLDRIELRGRLPHPQAVAAARSATLFVLPSLAEAFGVSYVEAMAAGIPAIGARGEDGPEEIAAAGGGMELVPPRRPQALAEAIDGLLSDPARLAMLRGQARDTVTREFTWERCGRETLTAYADVLGDRPAPRPYVDVDRA